MTYAVAALFVVFVAAGLYLGVLYNSLVQKRNRVANAWAQIDVQLRRRRGLIPDLVETAKGYAAHERGTFEAVTQARAAAAGATTTAEIGASEGLLTQAIGRLFAVAEAYPELKADESFLDLQEQLRDAENRLAISRRVYNDAVLTYDDAIRVFPVVLLAGRLGFTALQFFEVAEPADREVQAVGFRAATDAGTDAPVA
jgi:LemA protein